MTSFSSAQAPSEMCFLLLLLLQVDIRSGMKLDEKQYQDDFFDLRSNSCASVYDDLLCLMSVSEVLLLLLQLLLLLLLLLLLRLLLLMLLPTHGVNQVLLRPPRSCCRRQYPPQVV
jgi:hypothetical protein